MMRWVLVTGANKGIGLAIVEKLLQDFNDVSVFLGSRSVERGKAAIASLPSACQDRVQLVEIDVASNDSIVEAAKTVKSILGDSELYGVVNNAGIWHAPLAEVLKVNVWAIKHMMDSFVPLIRSHNGRIVNVTSASGPMFVAGCSSERQMQLIDADISWEAIESLLNQCSSLKEDDEEAFKQLGFPSDKYGLSKALANALTLWAAKKYPNLSVNSCTPGFIETDLTRPFAAQRNTSIKAMGAKPPSEGAFAPVTLLMRDESSDDVGKTGRYYGSDAKRSPLHKYRGPGEPEFDGTI